MSGEINPSAFPFPGTEETAPGMTLRDYFAGQALSNPGLVFTGSKPTAETCYRFADAMLAERGNAALRAQALLAETGGPA